MYDGLRLLCIPVLHDVENGFVCGDFLLRRQPKRDIEQLPGR